MPNLDFFLYYKNMKSILIKDTTRAEREKIVQESLENGWDVGCGTGSAGINYDLYIEGKVELKDLNRAADCGFEVAHPAEQRSLCSGEGFAD